MYPLNVTDFTYKSNIGEEIEQRIQDEWQENNVNQDN